MLIDVSFVVKCEDRVDERELAELVGNFVRNLPNENPNFEPASNVTLSDFKMPDTNAIRATDDNDDEEIEEAVY